MSDLFLSNSPITLIYSYEYYLNIMKCDCYLTIYNAHKNHVFMLWKYIHCSMKANFDLLV